MTEPVEEMREDEWKIRTCETYSEEYSDCKSFKARFHQYFIFGETIDCNQWKRDFENCKAWQEEKSETAYNDLVKSENERRLKRLKPHYENDIWKKRSSPPDNWNKPLPEWMQKDQEQSFLGEKANELKNNIDPEKRYLCSIS